MFSKEKNKPTKVPLNISAAFHSVSCESNGVTFLIRMYGNCVLGVPAAFFVETISAALGLFGSNFFLHRDFTGIFSVIFCSVFSFEDLGRKCGTQELSVKPCSHLHLAKDRESVLL